MQVFYMFLCFSAELRRYQIICRARNLLVFEYGFLAVPGVLVVADLPLIHVASASLMSEDLVVHTQKWQLKGNRSDLFLQSIRSVWSKFSKCKINFTFT